MPELPEVETITRALSVLKGKSFRRIEIRSPKSFVGQAENIIDKPIFSVTRRGKLIIFELAGGKYLVIHLKMTGQLMYKLKNKNEKGKIIGGHPDPAYRRQTTLPHRYTRVILSLSDGSRLFFNDLRLFGWMKILTVVGISAELDKIGVEPLPLHLPFYSNLPYSNLKKGSTLHQVKELSKLELRNLIGKYPRRRIKEFLQDQKLIAGIGNIYASEILFCAGILPQRITGSLITQEIDKIYGCEKKILVKAIKLGGTSFSDYRVPDGSRGGYLDAAWVYQREGKPCKKCLTAIRREKIGQRSAFFCPKCQK